MADTDVKVATYCLLAGDWNINCVIFLPLIFAVNYKTLLVKQIILYCL